MSWQDRDYYRYASSPPAYFGRLPLWSVTTWLIAINVAVFLVDRALWMMLGIAPLYALGYFSQEAAITHLQVWRFFTFQFLHASLGHIFFNMLGLYFFGPLIEDYLGRRRYLAFYLLCGTAGSLGYVLLWHLGLLGYDPQIPLVGASAGLFGILIAAARVAPDARVLLLFPPIPLRLRTLAWILVAIAAYTVLTGGYNAGGQAAHLGGAVLGAILIQYPRALNVFTWRPRRRDWRRGEFPF